MPTITAYKRLLPISLPVVNECGHKLDLNRQPSHRNCESCWFAWFNSHAEIVQQLDEMFVADNGAMIEQLQGTKFLKRYLQFMATIAQWKKFAEDHGFKPEINE